MIYYESDWANHDSAERTVAAAAIRAIGTNAVPCLLEWSRNETPGWHRNLARVLPRRIGNSRLARATVYRGYHRAEAARFGFLLLGTNTVGAIPELSSMMMDPSRPETATRAIEVLSCLGPEGFRVLARALADTKQPFRGTIATCIAFNSAHYLGTNTCLAPLRAAMDDPDPTLRAGASNLVTRLTPRQAGDSPPQ